ncbi:MAG: carbohydrate kinase [Candidatus Dormibacteraeota bacterium]|nr:carbohydrate kinase [Candidatus Dormibacteraeota bacterium]
MILVCGEALIDVLENGDDARRLAAGGGPFNTARALARLDIPTAFLGHLSTDAYGRELAGLLRSDGVNLDLTTTGPEPTTIAVAKVDNNGLAEYEFLVEGTSAPNLTRVMVPEKLSAEINALHVGTLGLVLEPMASTLAALMKRESGRILIMLDPNVRQIGASDPVYRDRLESVIPLSTIVKASVQDMAWLYPGLDYKSAAARMLERGVRLVVVTLGMDGAFAATEEFSVAAAAPAINVVDTVGAGDTFGAALLARLFDYHLVQPDPKLDNSQVKSALRFACVAAAITCSRSGADPPYRSELQLDEALESSES